MSSAPANWISPDEYLLREERAERRSEYLDGRAYAMAGASFNHIGIVSNLTARCVAALRAGPCFAAANELRIQTGDASAYFYPDLVITCGPEFLDGRKTTLLNPKIIIEVLSPSTERFDRGIKFERYTSIPSVREIWLIAQDRKQVDRYIRTLEDRWLFELHREGSFAVEEPAMEITIDEIYDRVEFPPEDQIPATGP